MHRLNGKVSGFLRVPRASVRFQDVDLHAYIVGSDGRAYTAISGVPQPAARALLPLLPLGGLFAWLFALEEPGAENGFSITGERRALGCAVAPRGGFWGEGCWGFSQLALGAPTAVLEGREGQFGVVPFLLPRR